MTMHACILHDSLDPALHAPPMRSLIPCGGLPENRAWTRASRRRFSVREPEASRHGSRDYQRLWREATAGTSRAAARQQFCQAMAAGR